jgi:N-acetylneuraminic acid mutarotase
MNDTAPTGDRYNLSIAEILPAIGGGGTGTPPTISMTSPAPNGIVANKTTVSADATSATSAISGVQFLLDGVNLGGEVMSPPYFVTWDTTTANPGTHTLSAIAYDSADLSTTASAITVTVDNSGNPAIVGSWSSPVSLPAVAVNLVLQKDGTVLFYQDGSTPTIWDYINNRFTNVSIPVDLFCSGHAMMADGRILVVGGYGGSSNKIGISNAEIFDRTDNSWTVVPKMAYSRWYPTATTLSDGRVLVTAGWQTTNHTNAGVPEIYDPSTNKWTQLNNANNPFETYPFMFMLSDGRVIHTGGSEYATDTEVLDINAQTWTVVDSRIIDGASATMYLPGKIMKAGSAADSQDVGISSNTTFTLDLTQPAPKWQQTPSMAYARSFMNLTTLPDGTVLVTGGESDKNGGNVANAVYAAELWSPATQTWTTMASMHTPREYHGTALLLPDGRVLESGMGADFGNVPDQLSAEFYSPPYLFKGARPTITQAPSQIQFGGNFFVATPDAANITSAVLIRTGAVTHFFDQNTRFVPVSFQQTAGGLTITAPANGFLAPPGFYMLFLVNSNGVPAVAPILQLTP